MSRGGYSLQRKETEFQYTDDRLVAYPKDQVDKHYEEYLQFIQEKNRVVKKLSGKDEKQIELERKEQGFSLYLNGANANIDKRQTRVSKTRRTKTSEGRGRKNKIPTGDGEYVSVRASTAPEKHRRKNWGITNVKVKTARGDKVSINAPEILTGNYGDDFETDVSASYSYRSSDSSSSEEDENFEDTLALDTKACPKIENKLLLSVKDIKKLRQSLETNASIRESLAFVPETESSSTESEIEEDVRQSVQRHADSSAEQRLKPDDVIVLEFSPSMQKKHDLRTTSSSQSNTRKDVVNFKPASEIQEFKQSFVSRKERPLSACRRSNKDMEDPEQQVSEVFQAMRDENRITSPREVQSAPIRPTQLSTEDKLSQVQEKGRPSSSNASAEVNSVEQQKTPSLPEDNDLQNIVQRVLQMDAKGQRNLLKALSQIEDGTASVPEKNLPLRPTLPVSNMIKPGSDLAGNDSEIKLHLLTNWGHNHLIGLTGLQFFDLSGNVIPIDSNSVTLNGLDSTGKDVSVLFNNKTKTVKEKNMWSCKYTADRPAVFTVPLNLNGLPQTARGLSKVKIWNYNKNLMDLSIGVRQCEIYLNDRLVFQGEIDKGCGNQIFDYGKVVDLQSEASSAKSDIKPPPCNISDDMSKLEISPAASPLSAAMDNVSLYSQDWDSAAPTDGSHTHRVLTAADDGLRRPEVSPSSPTKTVNRADGGTPAKSRSSKANGETKSKRKRTPRKSKMAARLDGSVESAVNTSGSLVEAKTAEHSVDVKTALSPVEQTRRAAEAPPASDDESLLQQIRKITSNKKHERPDWLEGKEAVAEAPERVEDPLLENWPVQGVPELPTLLDVDSESRGASPSYGRRSARPHAGESTFPADSKAGPSSAGREQRMEDSWASLSIFDRSQRGRISVDVQDDILDEYLFHQKERNGEQAIAESPEQDDKDESFTIPELPAGRELVIFIHSTWGDRHYVGLNGIELFTKSGELAPIAHITADPADINVLPEYSRDPRVVGNLLDGVNRTRDDTHMWLTPFSTGAEHRVCVTLARTCHLAMMRIWNYNKSRIHSYRGAREISVTLDSVCIFKGEITRACGGIIGSAEQFGDTVLFTMDESILELVSRHDRAFEVDYIPSDDEEDAAPERPPTDDGHAQVQSRPYTTAHGRVEGAVTGKIVHSASESSQHESRVCSVIRLDFTETWGDPFYLGLTGLELVGADGESVPVTMEMVQADPRDLHVLPGYERDDRTLDKLFDGSNLTVSDEHMWLVPFTAGESHWVEVRMTTPTAIHGLRVWNYNKKPEDTYRGAKICHIHLDDRQVSPSEGFLLRKGPGNVCFDFAQEISFYDKSTTMTFPPSTTNNLNTESQQYDSVCMPRGFIYQFHLISTWGDQYYIGLNGLEFYDERGHIIPLSENHIAAYPDSINWLDEVDGDVRTPDKLVDGVNDTKDGQHMWLSPVLPSIMNKVYVIFDKPMTVSMIKLWNYSKTSRRGVKDFALLVDDLLVYNGTLQKVSESARGIIPTCDVPQQYYTILLTDKIDIVQREKHTVITNQTEEQDVQLMNDRQMVAKNKQKPAKVNQALRPTTSVPRRGTCHK